MRAIHSLEDIFVQSCLCCMYWFMGAMARRPTNGREHRIHFTLTFVLGRPKHFTFFFITDAKEKSMHRKFRVIGICSTHILTHYYYHELEPTKGLFWPSQEVHLRFSLAISFALLLHSTSSQFT